MHQLSPELHPLVNAKIHVTRHRCRPHSLPEDPSEWLAPGTPGTRKTLEVGHDGLFYQLPEQPCIWEPPSASMPDRRLVLLPDGQYMHLPEQAPGASGRLFEYEAGGRMRSEGGSFQRVQVRYDASGSLAAVISERFGMESGA